MRSSRGASNETSQIRFYRQMTARGCGRGASRSSRHSNWREGRVIACAETSKAMPIRDAIRAAITVGSQTAPKLPQHGSGRGRLRIRSTTCEGSAPSDLPQQLRLPRRRDRTLLAGMQPQIRSGGRQGWGTIAGRAAGGCSRAPASQQASGRAQPRAAAKRRVRPYWVVRARMDYGSGPDDAGADAQRTTLSRRGPGWVRGGPPSRP